MYLLKTKGGDSVKVTPQVDEALSEQLPLEQDRDGGGTTMLDAQMPPKRMFLNGNFYVNFTSIW